MRSIAGRLRRSEFVKNFSLLSMGSVVSQAILILSSPILTRLFSPDEFGIQSVTISIAGVATILYTLQYDMAIVLPTQQTAAERVRILVLRYTVVALGIALVLASLLWACNLHTLFGDIPGAVLLFSAVYAWVLAYERISTYTNIRAKRFSRISLAVTGGSIVASVFFIVTGYVKGGYLFLILGVILNHALNSLIQNWGTTRSHRIPFRLTAQDTQLLQEYRDFPRFRLPQSLMNSLSQNLPALIFAGFFSPAIAGLYALARKIIKLPGMVVADALRKVYYQKAVELTHEHRQVFPSLLGLTAGLAAVGLIPYGIIMIFGSQLFSFVFGSQWQVAGRYAAWLSLWSYVGFTNIPAVAVIPVFKLQKQNMWYETIMISTRIAALLSGVVLQSALISVIAFSVSGAVLNGLLIVWVLRYVHHQDRTE